MPGSGSRVECCCGAWSLKFYAIVWQAIQCPFNLAMDLAHTTTTMMEVQQRRVPLQFTEPGGIVFVTSQTSMVFTTMVHTLRTETASNGFIELDFSIL